MSYYNKQQIDNIENDIKLLEKYNIKIVSTCYIIGERLCLNILIKNIEYIIFFPNNETNYILFNNKNYTFIKKFNDINNLLKHFNYNI